MASRSLEEIGTELAQLLRRREKLRGDMDRTMDRLRDVEREALAWVGDPIEPPVTEKVMFDAFKPLSREQAMGGNTYQLSPIADTMTFPSASPPETWVERENAAYARGVEFAKDALAKSQPPTSSGV